MAVNNTIMHTDSEKTSSYRYMKRRAVHLMIKCRVEKFEELMNSTEPGKGVLWSKYVSSTLSPRVIWKLELYPNGETRKYRNNVSIYLNLTGPMAKKKETLQASFRLYLISGSDGTSDTMLSCTYDFGEENYNWGMPKVSHNRVKKALRADGSLLVAAEVDFLPPDDHTLDVDLLQWPTNFSKFYGDVGSSDCRIEIGGVAIPAHKFPLMACSPVFKEMFTNPAAEEFKSGVIKVTDFQRPESMRALVRYCYQGMLDVETMDGEWGMEIFKLAAKYCIDDLKAVLEEHFIERRLSEQNVIEMALLADSYFASKLKEACIELIVEEGDIVFESPDWKRLEKTRPKLAIQLAIAAYREK